MKNKQEQIEEMARHMCCIADEHYNCKNCVVNSPCIYLQGAAMNYNNGYRKATEVIDEFVEWLEKYIESRNDLWDEDRPEFDEEFVKFGIQIVAYEMRQEVEK